MLSFHEVLTHFPGARRVGKEYRCRCPAHDDGNPSLNIREGDSGAPLFKCRSNHCATEDILAAAGLAWSDVLPERERFTQPSAAKPRVHPRDRPEAYWDARHAYCDAAGVERYQKVRHGTGKGKDVALRRMNGHNQFVWNLDGQPRLVYRLNELAGHQRVFVVEGEKCADALWALGLPATCNRDGAKDWKDEDSHALRAIGVLKVVVLTDNDEPGKHHAAMVAESAQAHGMAVVVVPPFPGTFAGYDVEDWLGEADRTADDLLSALTALVNGTSLELEDPGLAILDDAVDVIAQGQAIAEAGIQFVVENLIPAYGMLGLLVAYAKVGKTTLGQALAAAVATGQPFIGLETAPCRVLIIAAEDPPEYTAYLARHLSVPPGVLSFSRAPITLNAQGLARICASVTAGGYGLVLIASWQAVVAGLVKDENDNAGAVAVVEAVKMAARATGIPWLIDAHSGKGEDQSDEADPTKAMRGASAAAGSADYLLSLRYADGPFSPRRRLSGKGRFVNFEPILLTYDAHVGRYEAVGGVRSDLVESTWRLMVESDALTSAWSSTTALAIRCGLASTPRDVSGAMRRKITDAIKGRTGIDRQTISHAGKEVMQFRRSSVNYHWGDEGR